MFRFHKAHGQNIELTDQSLVATRTKSFANALIFSHRPLEPNEVFLFEIIGHEIGWAGNIRCGVTLHNPAKIHLPQYLLPDLYQLHQSFVYAIKPSSNDPFSDSEAGLRDDNKRSGKGKKEKSESFFNRHKETLICKCDEICSDISLNENVLTKDNTCSPCSVSSRIGLFITFEGDFYFLINGVQFGPCARGIPKGCNIYAVLDLYGMTKQVKIINCSVPKLSLFCKDLLWKEKSAKELQEADIPLMLKDDLLKFYENKTLA